eukprot:CAMPEP_0177530404 /NCGR_PEP_ID=MMETSP0369-20130122/53382_1 /TAXON_ID=447022 ORGANISM="Scrippsiella hangoei-like, Strain SHHI-4" /NCGR_SAMPLE_ID=MMETSP0369 /ASSEMBLY_ACC=CAM_ASM_000364 /LENGTH=85 /DNA_ID=CAMNT_0019011259 /DNA_START=345 /DNA_END=599 /DNA_ORIENTATION=-
MNPIPPMRVFLWLAKLREVGCDPHAKRTERELQVIYADRCVVGLRQSCISLPQRCDRQPHEVRNRLRAAEQFGPRVSTCQRLRAT